MYLRIESNRKINKRMARRSAGEEWEGQEIKRLGVLKHTELFSLLWFEIFVIAT